MRIQYLRSAIVAAGYVASAKVLWLQLLWYQGAPLDWVIIYAVQAILYGLIVLKIWSFRAPWAFGSAFIVAWVIGWMPIVETLSVLKEYSEHGNMDFSSLTRNLPLPIRVLYEFGGLPLVQFLVLAVVIGLLRVIQPGSHGDKAWGSR